MRWYHGEDLGFAESAGALADTKDEDHRIAQAKAETAYPVMAFAPRLLRYPRLRVTPAASADPDLPDYTRRYPIPTDLRIAGANPGSCIGGTSAPAGDPGGGMQTIEPSLEMASTLEPASAELRPVCHRADTLQR
jgi:hypothetical protein